MVDNAPQAAFYFSELFATYRHLVYSPGIDTPMPNKSETYRVEGGNFINHATSTTPHISWSSSETPLFPTPQKRILSLYA